VTRKLLLWFGICFLIFFVAFRPTAAANVFSSLGAGIMNVWHGFVAFWQSLFG